MNRQVSNVLSSYDDAMAQGTPHKELFQSIPKQKYYPKKSRHLDIHVPNRLIQLPHEVNLDKNNVMVLDGVSLWPLFYVKKK